jgi:LemA protein
MTTWIILAILAAAVIYAVAVFNRLVRQRNLAREGWSGIDVQLKRRTDLVPNLVEAVKAYAAHERAVLAEVTAMRASSIAASDVGSQAAAERGLQASLGKLLAVAEAYPDLKADKNFLALQEQLAGTEDQLQMARRYYNGTVRNLNIAVQSFPASLVAGLLGFRTEPYFELDDRSEAAAPGVAFQVPKS